MTSANVLASRIERLGDRFEEASARGVGSGMATTKREAKRNVRRNDSNVTGRLRDAIDLDTQTDIDTVGPNPTVASARVTIDEPYAPFVEYGTGSRQDAFPTASPQTVFPAPSPAPPLGKIRQWIIRKGITANEGSGFRRVNLIEEQEQLAYVIRQSIATFGNRPHPFARPAARVGFDETVDEVADELRSAMRGL